MVTTTKSIGPSFGNIHFGTKTRTTDTIDWYCETAFKVNRPGIVIESSYEGNACVG